MATVTFTSPRIPRDVTVYAVAGDRSTLLGIAKQNNIPIHHECGEGECGSCHVEVTPISGKPPMAAHLTEKEKTVLLLSGKVSREELDAIGVTDVAPKYRLACQYMLLDEDVVVKF